MTFAHKQTVSFRRRLVGVLSDGTRGRLDDWSEKVTVRATKRDLRPLGYWVVRFGDGANISTRLASPMWRPTESPNAPNIESSAAPNPLPFALT